MFKTDSYVELFWIGQLYDKLSLWLSVYDTKKSRSNYNVGWLHLIYSRSCAMKCFLMYLVSDVSCSVIEIMMTLLLEQTFNDDIQPHNDSIHQRMPHQRCPEDWTLKIKNKLSHNFIFLLFLFMINKLKNIQLRLALHIFLNLN